MAREGYLILDSHLHIIEPDDLRACHLDEPYRANAPRFFGAQQQKLADDSDDQGNADVVGGMEVQGLPMPAHGKMPSAAAWLDRYLASIAARSDRAADRARSVDIRG